ncbi:hypothetical protein AWL63_19120 [Sphingomonas panacis]|uniref:HEPN/Toprim N-terminal domain-containing protein n=1 Tax=Sphingomonas panacis TaxID=1560345 RepID=A0A1B3ZE91_9SPHN|nr:HEPN/Toprim-associated domain-containing protein [Sphingomonas panacis]AOH85742.1 hypothetical protein AWL63_19120 [Sphingomonas panacis]
MGTEIHLEIEGMSLDWAKNGIGFDHGFLFQEGDRTRRRSDGIDYDYFSANNEDPAAYEAAFARPLGRVLPRLDLVGHNLEGARLAYEEAVRDATASASYVTSMNVPGVRAQTNFMPFDEFCAFCRRFPLTDLDTRPVRLTVEEGKEAPPPGRFAALTDEISRIPVEHSPYRWMSGYAESERQYFGSAMFILDAYSMLQVLGHDGRNADAELVWQYGTLVENGWEEAASFITGAPRYKRVLVATEGTSDALIVKRALNILRPDVADFFHFIDVNESHPFSGTGNLVKFAEGLVRIDVQNNILFLLDNDAEGRGAHCRLQRLGMPENMRSMVLPDHETFCEFPARGPEGISSSDINGRAAAIECYLDLALPNYGPAQVLWSNFKKDVEAWHGALEHKETYTRHFFAQSDEILAGGFYDTSKLELVMDRLIAEATVLASGRSAGEP